MAPNAGVAPEIAGRIEQVHMRRGDPVARGRTMANLGLLEIRQELEMTNVSLRAGRGGGPQEYGVEALAPVA